MFSRPRRIGAYLLLVVLCLVPALAVTAQAPDGAAGGRRAVLLTIDGAIGPATADYVQRGLGVAATSGAAVVILRIDTPGGLLDSTRAIIRDTLASPVPVVAYVAPAGAHAASAGTFLVYAAHVAAMAPGTSLGAATPVSIGAPGLPGGNDDGDGGQKDKGEKTASPSKHENKAVNDAIATIESLAQLRGRNADFATRAVREAATATAQDALKLGIVEIIATDVADLLAQLDGRAIEINGTRRTLETSGLRVEALTPDWRARFLAIITNPNVAAILMMIGIYGIIFEFYNPGFAAPGVIGAICLLLALYAFHVLPIDYTGLALTILGIGLMIAEAFIPSFGIIGLGGLAAFVLGAVMLVDTDVPGYSLSWTLIASVAFVIGGSFVLVMSMVLRSRRQAPVTGVELLLRLPGRVVDWGAAGQGTIVIHGEHWAACAPAPLAKGTVVRIVRVDGLVLHVEPLGLREET